MEIAKDQMTVQEKQFRDLLRSSVAIDFNSSNITKGKISRWKKVMDSTNDFF